MGVEWLLIEGLGLPDVGEIDGLSYSLALLTLAARTQGAPPTSHDRRVIKAIIRGTLWTAAFV